MQVQQDRKQSLGNDLASIMYQLKKLNLNDIPDVYIYFEYLCEQNMNTINKFGLIQLIQSFGTNYVHSKTLFTQTYSKLMKLTNSFETLLPHEFALVVSYLGNFTFKSLLSADLTEAIR